MSRALADLDAAIHAALVGSGLSDIARYIAPGAAPLPARVYVDHSLVRLGMYSAASDASCTVTLLRADVPMPVPGARIEADGQSYTLRLLLEQDDGVTIWGAA